MCNSVSALGPAACLFVFFCKKDHVFLGLFKVILAVAAVRGASRTKLDRLNMELHVRSWTASFLCLVFPQLCCFPSAPSSSAAAAAAAVDNDVCCCSYLRR